MQAPKVTEINRLTAHAAPAQSAPQGDDAPRLNAWPSNRQPSSSTASESAS
jgi:hypothetical protein